MIVKLNRRDECVFCGRKNSEWEKLTAIFKATDKLFESADKIAAGEPIKLEYSTSDQIDHLRLLLSELKMKLRSNT